MEQVLETCERPHDAQRPVVCMDEQPVQMVKDTRAPVAATREHPERVDHEYERAGTAAVFLFCEALQGSCQATARERRTKTDWALEVAALPEGRYAGCEKVTLVLEISTRTPRVPSTRRSSRPGRGSSCGALSSATRRSMAAG